MSHHQKCQLDDFRHHFITRIVNYTHFYYDGNTQTSAPTEETIARNGGYLQGGDGHVSFDANTGEMKYDLLYDEDTYLTLYVPFQSNSKYLTIEKKILFRARPSYTITVTADPATGGTASADVEFADEGDEVTLSATPSAGYLLQSWTVTQTDATAVTVTNNKFTMPASNVTVTANFALKPRYTISNGTLTGGSLTIKDEQGNDITEAYEGQKVVLTAASNTGYSFYNQEGKWSVTWSGDSPIVTLGGNNTASFIMPNGPVNVSATFDINSYQISTSVNDADRGSVTGAGSYNYNTTATLTAIPETGYKFSQWNDGNTVNPRTVTVTAAASYTATFVPEEYGITVSNSITNGSVTAPQKAEYKSEVTLTATPATGYEFTSWEVKQGETPVTVINNKFTMPAGPVTVSATFTKQKYPVQIVLDPSNAAGTVTSPAAGDYEYQKTISLAATANEGYTFSSWEVTKTGSSDAVTVSNNQFTMPAAGVTVTAHFSAIDYTITGYTSSNGSVTAASATSHAGETVTLTISPAEGMRLKAGSLKVTNNVTGTAITVSNENTFTMPAANVTITAEFENIPYQIQLNASTGGSVERSDNEANKGEQITLTAVPASGYSFTNTEDNWSVKDASGNTISPVGGLAEGTYTYVFTMPASNVTVSATFEKSSYSVTVNQPSTGGEIAATGATDLSSVDMGTEITLTATPASGYTLMGWVVRDAENLPVTVKNGKFTMPGSNVTVTAQFQVAQSNADIAADDASVTGIPKIGGNVFGGGRMAGINNKATTHTSKDSDPATTTCQVDIYAATIQGGIFGGNDISGDVLQPDYGTSTSHDQRSQDYSTNVFIHNTCSKASSANEVYGGGNGYYNYVFTDNNVDYSITPEYLAGMTMAQLTQLYSKRFSADATVTVKDFAGNEVATFSKKTGDSYSTIIPIAHNTFVKIGDAVLPANDVLRYNEVYGGAKMAWVSGNAQVEVNSGTINKVFAGNNWGGVVYNTELTINGTKKPVTEPTKETFGDFKWDLAGQYNKVQGFGIGEAYGGGNAVDVQTTTTVTVNDGYVRTLFGGNNLADMYGVPSVHLDGGSVQTTYGGGNAGDMKGLMAGAQDVSVYLSNALFEAYDGVTPFTNFGTKGFSTYCSNDAYLYFYSTETILQQKSTDVPLRIGNVYGGCRAANVDMSTFVRASGADYVGTIYAGCDMAGSVGYKGNMDGAQTLPNQVEIGYYDADAENPQYATKNKYVPVGFPIINLASMVTVTNGFVSGDVFAGGNGDYQYVTSGDSTRVYANSDTEKQNLLTGFKTADLDRPWVRMSVATMEGGTLTGNLYGGGNNAPVGKVLSADSTLEARTYVLLGQTLRGSQLASGMKGPRITGTVYAGGKKADVYGAVDVLVKAGTEVNTLYAGNDISGSITGSNRGQYQNLSSGITTTLYGKDANGADYTHAYCGQPLNAPFGKTDNNAQVYVRVEGAGTNAAGTACSAAKITNLYGGGNGDYTYSAPDGNGLVTVTDADDYNYGTVAAASAAAAKPRQQSCWLDIRGTVGTSYGGGNAAEVDYANTYISEDAHVTTAFGGGNAATATKGVNLWVTCNGTTKANSDAPDFGNPNVGTVFGGNNLADMYVVPRVYLNGGTIRTSYGGGNNGAMKGCTAGSLDVSSYFDDDLFLSFDNVYPYFHNYCNNEAYLFFYGAETIVEEKEQTKPLSVRTVYGGCRAANVLLSTYVRVIKPSYVGTVYGGCDIAGSVGKGNPDMPVTTEPMQIEYYDPTDAIPIKTLPAGFPILNLAAYSTITDGTISGDFFAGGNGDYFYQTSDNTTTAYAVNANGTRGAEVASFDNTITDMPWVKGANICMEGGHVSGNIYGGGNNATVGAENAHGRSYLMIGKTKRGVLASGATGPVCDGIVYAGGKKANVFGTVDVLVKAGTRVNTLFAGNDISGSVQGGNRGVYAGSSNNNITTPIKGGGLTYNGTRLDNVNGATEEAKKLKAQTYVRVEGAGADCDNNDRPAANIGTLYGGGNGDYDYTSGIYKDLPKPSQESCWLDIKGKIGTSYGGGNAAEVDYSYTYITGDAEVDKAFAGGNSATVNRGANLWLDCDGTRSTSDFVTDKQKTPNVGTIFGGNNLADMHIVPWMELHRGSVRTVYGGGNMGNMLGRDALFVDGTADINPAVFTHQYPTFASDSVLLFAATDVMIDSKYKYTINGMDTTDNPNDGLIVGDVYGGCKSANVGNSSYVRITHAQYIGNVYGGCDVSGSVGFLPGQLEQEMLTSEGKLQVFFTDGRPATKGITIDNTLLNTPLYNASSYILMTGGTVSGSVYGGGNGNYDYTKAEYAGLSAPFAAATTANITGGTIQGNLYGGGNKAEVGHIITQADIDDASDIHKTNGKFNYMGSEYAVGDTLTNMSYIYLGKGATEGTSVQINGSVFGGCKNANVYGGIDILALQDVEIKNLFAGNDISGSVLGGWRGTRFSRVEKNITSLIGTGTDAASRAKDMLSFSGDSITGEKANVYVRVMPGAKIINLFGGGNGDYAYVSSGTSGVLNVYEKNQAQSQENLLGMVNAASAEEAKPVQQSTLLDVAGIVTTAYGGGNAANIGTSNLYIVKDAVVGTAFAGGNAATVTKSANIFLDCDGQRSTSSDFVTDASYTPNVGTIFGGNNIADMAIVPWMQLHRGSVRTVYGGGNKGNMLGHDALFIDGSAYFNPAAFSGSYPDFAAGKVLVFAATDVMIDSKYGKDASGNDVPNDGLIVGDVYAGCKSANVNNTSYVRITHAQYIGNVYGGCDVSGSVGFLAGTLTDDMLKDGNLQVFYTNGVNETFNYPVAPSVVNTPLYNASSYVYMTGGTVSGNVYGGGNGDYDYTQEGYVGLSAPFSAATTVNIAGGTIKGNLYGGGNKAEVGHLFTEAGSYMGQSYAAGDLVPSISYIYLGKGATDGSHVTVEGSVYGGCKNANVYGAIDILTLPDVKLNNLFAGNDVSGSINGTWRGTRFSPDTNNITCLIGSGSDDASRAKDKLSFSEETLTAENAKVYVRVMPGAEIARLFGGGNGDYDYSSSGEYAGISKPYVESSWLDVRGKVGTVYGGGNAANNKLTNAYIMGEAEIGTSSVPGAVYGGCKSADVEHRTHVMLASYTPNGGSAQQPTVYGNVFGGCDISGNVGMSADAYKGQLDITAPGDKGYAKVDIKAGTVTGRVFGGGNGLESADGAAYYTANASAANNGLTQVGDAPNESYQYPAGSTYQGKTLPQVENSWLTIVGSTVGAGTGSGYHTVFGGGQGAGTRVIHNVDLLLGNTDVNTTIKGTSYGGSYAGFVNTNCDDHTRTVILGSGDNTRMQGDIYGGSYGNHVRGKIDLNINNIKIGADEAAAGIFAGNNNAGQPECEAEINYVGDNCNINIYGGGNEAPFYGTTRITLTRGMVGNVFGGGNNADVYGNTIVEILGGQVCYDVYGGGNKGDVLVNTTSYAHQSYGGNTYVIVRDDCLKLGTDADGREPGTEGYQPTFEVDPLTGNYRVNRGDVYYSTVFGNNDPYATDKGLLMPAPNTGGADGKPLRSKIEIGGSVYGGGNAADVSGHTTVIIGDQAENQ